MNALSLQRIQVRGQCGDQCFTFTGPHLCDPALVQNNAADQLYAERLHVQCTLRTFTDNRERFHQQIIQRLTFFEALSELIGLCPQFLIRQCLHGRPQFLDGIHGPADSFQFPFAVCSE